MTPEPSPTEFRCSSFFQQQSHLVPTTLRVEPLQLVCSVGGTKIRTIRVPHCCIYGYQEPSRSDSVQDTLEDLTITLHYVAFASTDMKDASSPRTETARIVFEQQADVQRFMALAKQFEVFPKRRRILLLVSPNGGVGKAKNIHDTIVKPMLKHSGLVVQEQFTEYSKHAIDIAHKVDLTQVDTLVVISGDGVLHEIINGLLSRPDWEQARRLPISIIPAGSGNAIATSIGIKSPIVATLALIRGETAKLDIFSLSQIDRPRIYSMLLFSWGMMADADIESDKYRWLGPLRFEIAGFIRMIRLRRYAGKVYILPPSEHDPSSTTTTLASDPSTSKEPTLQFESVLKNTNEEPPKPWRLLPNMPFYSMLLALNCPSVGEDLFFTDTIRFNDGNIRLWYSCETRFWKIVLPFVLDQANGKLVKRGLMQDVECGGLLIVPGVEGNPDLPATHEIVHPDMVTSKTAKQNNVYTKPGIFDVDGEVMPTARTLIEILPRFMNIVVPEWFHNEHGQEGDGDQTESSRGTNGSGIGIIGNPDREQAAKAKEKAKLVVEAAKSGQTQTYHVKEAVMALLATASVVIAYLVSTGGADGLIRRVL